MYFIIGFIVGSLITRIAIELSLEQKQSSVKLCGHETGEEKPEK